MELLHRLKSSENPDAPKSSLVETLQKQEERSTPFAESLEDYDWLSSRKKLWRQQLKELRMRKLKTEQQATQRIAKHRNTVRS